MELPNFSGKSFLAPMSGISDPAFRLLCRRHGAAYVVTELTSVDAIIEKEAALKLHPKGIAQFTKFSEDERPVGIQLFGNNIDKIVKAAKIVEPYFDVIDFNMGCPATHITKQMAGAALMQEARFNEKLFSLLVRSVNKPVTLKIRMGVKEKNNDLYRQVGLTAQRAGIQMVCLHGRTVSQGYSGKANWDAIKDLKSMLKIPVVGNGDIISPEDAKKMLDYTKCDYVMIGRGARGNPELFKCMDDYLRTSSYEYKKDKFELGLEYIELAKFFKVKYSNIRMQIIQFTKGLKDGAQMRLDIGKIKALDELENYLKVNS